MISFGAQTIRFELSSLLFCPTSVKFLKFADGGLLLPPRPLRSCSFSSGHSASSLHLPDYLFCFNHQTGQIQTEKSSWDYRENCWSYTALHPGLAHLQSQEMGSKHHCWPNKTLTQPSFPPSSSLVGATAQPGTKTASSLKPSLWTPKPLTHISILSKNILIYSVLYWHHLHHFYVTLTPPPNWCWATSNHFI